MRFSLWLYPYGRWGSLEAMSEAAMRAEQLGFDSISISDHIICPTGPDAAGVTPVWHDFFVLTTHIADKTERIKLVGSLVLPYRRLLPMAKQISSVDMASKGRFVLVACVGWLRQEFEMLGVPFHERGAITDEYLRAMKILWTEESPRFEGKYCRFSDIIFEPKCTQKPHVPMWIGGSGPRAIDRLMNFGDGWMPMGDESTDSLGLAVREIKDLAASRGRNPETLEFRYTLGVGEAEAALRSISRSINVEEPAVARMRNPESADDVAEAIDRFRDAGFTELCISFAWNSPTQYLDRIEWFATRVMPLVADP
ncbi:MAG TPA: TIGR03619 family F420-dependent LLM class oxidoreductase [Nitrospiraceae bacterium]|nr:TIGR03619 family F420-dependent LLM class oxidoreductase [Nitrospiraceae bacterium]